LNNLFEHLTKKLHAKENELKALQEDKRVSIQNSSHFSTINQEGRGTYDSTHGEALSQYGANDIEKIVKELESLKQELKQEKESEREIGQENRKPLNQNNSFSHFTTHEKISTSKSKPSNPKQMPDIEKQIRNEIQTLIANKAKFQKDIVEFDKEFSNTDLNSDM